jgi:hypothetical protein
VGRIGAVGRTLASSLSLAVAATLLPALAPAAPAPAAAAERACIDAPQHPFTDLSRSSPHAEAVDCLLLHDVARGRQIDRLGAVQELRRDQLATIMVNAVEATGLRLPRPSEPRFGDLDGNAHADAVERLAHAGIVEGREPGRYAPASRVSRGAMAAFLVRSHEHVTGVEVEGEPDRFDDVEGHVHEDAINALAELQITQGRTGERFAPDEGTARAEIASFVARLLGVLAEADELTPARGGYEARITALPASLRRTMTGTSWRSGCPVGLDDLRLLTLTHHDLDGQPQWGHLVVHRQVAADLAEAFRRIHDAGFPIERMRIVDRYGADDDRSMADNNTHAFNCRRITGGSSWSKHAYGWAVDINPVQNPYVRGSTVLPEAGRAYLDRRDVRPGMIVRPDPVTQAFDALGWTWGGDWNSLKDYQHFER